MNFCRIIMHEGRPRPPPQLWASVTILMCKLAVFLHSNLINRGSYINCLRQFNKLSLNAKQVSISLLHCAEDGRVCFSALSIHAACELEQTEPFLKENNFCYDPNIRNATAQLEEFLCGLLKKTQLQKSNFGWFYGIYILFKLEYFTIALSFLIVLSFKCHYPHF